MTDRCPHCQQPLPAPQIRFADLDWLRQLAARDQPSRHWSELAPDHEEATDAPTDD
jgi:hypothetical protein